MNKNSTTTHRLLKVICQHFYAKKKQNKSGKRKKSIFLAHFHSQKHYVFYRQVNCIYCTPVLDGEGLPDLKLEN